MSQHLTLKETQALFAALLRGDDVTDERLSACFVGNARMGVRARVGVYQGMYLARLIEALRSEFPWLAHALGADFDAVAGRYARAHPSEHPDVGLIGRLLPEYLQSGAEQGLRADLGYLAALERALNARGVRTRPM